MRRDDQAGQAAVEAIAGAAVLVAVTAAVIQMLMLVAGAGVLQAETRDAAIRQARSADGPARISRSRSVGAAAPGVSAPRLTARAVIAGPSQ